MPAPKSTDREFAEVWNRCDGRARDVAAYFDMPIQKVYSRRATVERNLGIVLSSAGAGGHTGRGDAGAPAYNYRPRVTIDGFAGMVVVFNDCHWWPRISRTAAYEALIEIVKEEKPKLIVGNGDLLDGARISRFGRSDWAEMPRMDEELEEVKERCGEIRHAYRGARRIRTIGNHDQRFDKYLANRAGEFEGIGGFRLSEHLPEWEECMAVWVNGHTVFKHRWHGGVHAAWNNVVKAGVSMVTAHTHTLEARPYLDYRGLRWGCQGGTLANPGGPQFSYAEDNPSQGCSGFLVLTFAKDGSLFDPEICRVRDGVAYFRGQRVVSERKKAKAA